MIKEVIVVEGKDDISNVKSAMKCEVIATNGYYFGEKFLKKLENLQSRCGLIIFTDPDYAGNKIRSKISSRIKGVKHAFLDQKKAIKKDDIGIENAKKEDIIEAIKKAKPIFYEKNTEFSIKDLIENNLTIGDNAKNRRIKLGSILGIGYANSSQLVKKLNTFLISREEFDKAIKKL